MNPAPLAPRLDLLWLVPLGVLVVLGSFFMNLAASHEPPATPQPWLASGLAVVAVAGLLVSRRRPLPGVAVTFAGVTAFVLADLRDGPVYLTVAAGAFLVASRLDVRRWLRVVAAGTAAVCGALVIRTVADLENQRSLWQLVAVGAVTAAGAALGTLARSRAHALLERARAAATQEQLRMARDLHDGVGHGLAVIAMQAGVGLHLLDRDPTATRTSLEAIRDTARTSLEALRTELAAISGESAPRRPRAGVAELDDLLARVRAAGVDVTLAGSAGELPTATDALVHSVVQESLTNVLRHSGARRAWVRLSRAPTSVTVVVEDDGTGTSGHEEGMGLGAMRARVEEHGGLLTAGAGPDGGFVVRAELRW